jgi:hypothetical protein
MSEVVAVFDCFVDLALQGVGDLLLVLVEVAIESVGVDVSSGPGVDA